MQTGAEPVGGFLPPTGISYAFHANIIKYCNRPFMSDVERDLQGMAQRGVIPPNDFKISSESAQKMTDAIVDATNAVVGRNDTLVHLGDFMFGSRHDFFDRLVVFRKRIVCENIILIMGNHDDLLGDLFNNTGYFAERRWSIKSQEARRLFAKVYDHQMFSVEGQKIWCDHYPHRSWDCAHHGAINLYGHVHDLYKYEDNGKLQPADEQYLREGFTNILSDADPEVVQKLLDKVASLKGVDLTLDVGVDNRIRGENLPFGTPWSMDDIRAYMAPKRVKWEARQNRYQSHKSS